MQEVSLDLPVMIQPVALGYNQQLEEGVKGTGDVSQFIQTAGLLRHVIGALQGTGGRGGLSSL